MTLRQQDGFEQRFKPGKMAANDISHLSDPVVYYAAAASLVAVSMIFATLFSVISGTTSIHCTKKNVRNSAIKTNK